jgi:hypothetical protein
MNKKASEERDTAVGRGRQCSRLVAVSSGAGEETEARASVGASVLIPTGWKDLADSDGDRYCRAPEGFVYYWRHDDRLEHDVDEQTTAGPDLLPPRRGPRPKGIRGREQIIEALVGYSATVRCTLGRDGVIRPKPRSWQRYRGGLAASVQGVNTEALAEVLGQKPDWVRDWRRKNRANSGTGRSDASRPTSPCVDRIEMRAGTPFVVVTVPPGLKGMPENFMEELSTTLSAIRANTETLIASHAELRAIMLESVEILRANFPDDDRVALAVDRFVADALTSAD